MTTPDPNFESSNDLLDVKPKIAAPLDPGFRPMDLARQNFERAVRASGKAERVVIALERNGGLVSRRDLDVFPAGSAHDEASFRFIERTLKFMLWAYGGWKVYLSGPQALCSKVAQCYQPGGARAFDSDLMSRVYERPFTVTWVAAADIPPAKESALALGGHLDGCRIGFDLGASDYKVAAVRDGTPVFSTEIPWNPKDQPDPGYHYRCINEGLKQAQAHLPRVDAIGGSSAGVIVDSQIMVASLFRSVPRNEFDRLVKPMFHNLRQEWGVPLEVLNDGDVTALAGAMSLERNAMLGVAMGSSEAAGYLNRNGGLLGWLSELAFAPVDLNPAAAADEWSGDRGVGALYFSQQAVNKLAAPAGIVFPTATDLPTRLKIVQESAEKGDRAARAVFETIGVYLGYSVPLYRHFYDLENLLILGRVTSGTGGEIILSRAKSVLAAEFPELAGQISLFVPDEKSRRVGQAVAAASLPVITNKSLN
jgi:predicted NBD/HSP70 family sugar kinase